MVDIQRVRCVYLKKNKRLVDEEEDDNEEEQDYEEQVGESDELGLCEGVWFCERSKNVVIDPDFDLYTEANFANDVVELYVDKTRQKYTFLNGPKQLALYFSDDDYYVIPYDTLEGKKHAWYTKYARLSSDSLFVPESRIVRVGGKEEDWRHGRCALRSKLAISGRNVADKKSM